MKFAPVAFGLSGLLALITAYGLGVWAGMPVNPLTMVSILASHGGFVTRMTIVLLIGLGLWIMVLGALIFAKGRIGDTSLLSTLSLLPPGLGVVSMLLTGLAVFQGIQRTNTSDLFLIAPGLVEPITPLGFGLLLGAIATWLRARFAPAAE
jgi:hypothetical protein